MLKIKLFAAFAFLVFASCAFLFSGGKSKAQSDENAQKRDEILGKIAAYKIWQQVHKPEKTSDFSSILKTDVLTIDNSAAAG
jgi:hypothetical protein